MAREERTKVAMHACDNAGADSNARIHCGKTFEALGLSSFKFQCELVRRWVGGMTHEWGVALTDKDYICVTCTHTAPNRLTPRLPSPPLDPVATASAVLAHLGLDVPAFPTARLSWVQLSCRSARSPTRVVPRSRLLSPTPPPPDAHAHAQATPASFHSRHPAITLLPHSALLPRIPHLVLFSARTLQVLPVLLHSCCTAPHAPLAAHSLA
ncbi:hypothetical protein B0H13DRAFT_2578946 [Mycena leptocephala]|nr:hypothetical protein B0H13DRAFT_2578946 [Mycena leptocephala]